MFNALLNVRKFYRRKHDEFHSKYFTSFSQIITSLNRSSPRSFFDHTQTFESVALRSLSPCVFFSVKLFIRWRRPMNILWVSLLINPRVHNKNCVVLYTFWNNNRAIVSSCQVSFCLLTFLKLAPSSRPYLARSNPYGASLKRHIAVICF